MSRKRIVYDPILEHWSWAWLRVLGTVRGLWVGTMFVSLVAILQIRLDIASTAGTSWIDPLLQLNPLLIVVWIARHLQMREREREWEPPDATMRLLFSVA